METVAKTRLGNLAREAKAEKETAAVANTKIRLVLPLIHVSGQIDSGEPGQCCCDLFDHCSARDFGVTTPGIGKHNSAPEGGSNECC